MEHQINLSELQDIRNNLTVDRYGRLFESPFQLNPKRCENCQNWSLLPKADQPPCGWGVKGYCANGVRKLGRVVKTMSTSYCDDYKEK